MSCSAAIRCCSSSKLPSVGPLQVLEHQHDGLVFRCSSQEPDDGGEEEEAFGFGVGGFRAGEFREPPRKGGDQSTQIRSMFFDMGEETVLGGVGHEVVQSLGEQLIGGREIFFAMAEKDAGSVFERGPCCLGH